MTCAQLFRPTASCLFVALLMSGCARPPERPTPAAQQPSVSALPEACKMPLIRENEQLLRFDTTASHLHILAYRGGRLARFGHNHLINAKSMEGYVRIAPSPEKSEFTLCLPVAALEVDNPQLRAQAGEQFATPLDASAIAGTRHNMLSPQLLDADRYPFIVVQGAIIARSADSTLLPLTLTLRGQQKNLSYPSRIVVQARQVSATGELTLRQSDLGLEPFSALFGALLVQDELTIRYTLVAKEAL
ncbi:YceI family protein [Sedimenticola sp.]|uniref:YceI family protein n=1 Tax=Sedimenticola sp. TaxID=1940285 RepID=UPI003D14577A